MGEDILHIVAPCGSLRILGSHMLRGLKTAHWDWRLVTETKIKTEDYQLRLRLPIMTGTGDLQETTIILHLVSIVAESSVYPLYLVVQIEDRWQIPPPHPPTNRRNCNCQDSLCTSIKGGYPPYSRIGSFSLRFRPWSMLLVESHNSPATGSK